MSKRGVYVIRFQERNGKAGGLSQPKTFRATASNSKDASHKLRKKGARIVSVKLMYKL